MMNNSIHVAMPFGHRIAIVILLFLSLDLNATAYSQITLSVKDAPLRSVMQSIRKQSGYAFFIETKYFDVAKPVTVEISSGSLEEVLAKVFAGQPFGYLIKDKAILISPAKTVVEPRIDSLITVSGKVVNEKGEPIIGATVLVKGTNNGVTTDESGGFFISGVRINATLMITSVAFLSREVALRGKRYVGSISLKEFISLLDETQIIAYGQTSRRLNTGNISTIKAEDIEKSPVDNPLMAIAGRVPGVFIQQSSGIPGSGVKVVIQGQNSLLHGSDPFYVIDGVPYTAQLLPGLTNELGQSGTGHDPLGIATQGNPLNFINPQEIESIDVLKDADATSIYGSRAANGAIIITTKKGKAGKTSVSFNIQNGWGKITKKIDLLNTQQYLEMRQEAYKNDNIDIPIEPNSSAYDLTYWDQKRYTDWQKELIGGTAKYTNAIGSMSGGNSNIQYLFSASYQMQGTVTPSNLKDQKASIHFNLNSSSENKKLKFNLSGNYLFDDNRLALISSLANFAFTAPPNSPKLRNTDGSLNWEFLPNSNVATFLNPLALLDRKYNNRTTNLISSALISYQILPGLELKSSFGYNNLQSNEVQTTPLTAFAPSLRPFQIRTSSFNTSTISNWIIEPQLTYVKQLGPGKLDYLLGTTIQNEDRNREQLNASGFASDESMLNLKAASLVIVDGSNNAVIISKYKYNALFTRINYNISDKYIISSSIRRDGSSRFGKENRFHNFSSIAGAWIFSNEDLLKSHFPELSFGKIRMSFGTTGNDQIGDYTYLNLYGNTPTGGSFYQGIISLQPTEGFPNPYLKWEETKKFSSSLDLGFFHDRILVNTTYYRNKCSNQLVNDPLLSITGGSSVYQNKPITVQNSGLEISLNTLNINYKTFSWSSTINITIPKNILKSYGDVDVDAKNDLVGKSISTIKLYHFLGVDPTSGLYIVRNKEGKATSNPDPDIDKTVYINSDPEIYGGLQNKFTYKGLTIEMLFQFVKQNAPNQNFGFYPGATQSNQVTTIINRWKKPGDVARIQGYHKSFSAYSQWNMAAASNAAYNDASYIRMKNLSISYQFPTTWMQRIHIHNIRAYMQAQNLLTITNYVGADPENRTLAGLPPLKVCTIGLQLSL